MFGEWNSYVMHTAWLGLSNRLYRICHLQNVFSYLAYKSNQFEKVCVDFFKVQELYTQEEMSNIWESAWSLSIITVTYVIFFTR